MELLIDDDLKALADFMQQNAPASKLVPLATAIGRLAPILWGHFATDEILPLSLSATPPLILADDPHTQSCANGSTLAR
jgi:hypothetical protein